MDRSNICELVSVSYTTDTIGQKVTNETLKHVFCNISSVNAVEFMEGSRNGLRPELRVSMFRYDYDGELTAIVNGVRYGVYRTYFAKNDMIDLYLERKAGTQ